MSGSDVLVDAFRMVALYFGILSGLFALVWFFVTVSRWMR